MVEKSGEFIITRVFDAPRDKVWEAWTEAERLKQWWGPKGFSVSHCTVDLRPGGVMTACNPQTAKTCGAGSSIARS